MKKLPMLAVSVSSFAALLMGCSSQRGGVYGNYHIDPPQATLAVNTPLENRALSSAQTCVIAALRPRLMSERRPVLVNFFGNDTGQAAIQKDFQTHAVNVIAELGLTPVDFRILEKVGSKANFSNALIITGAATGLDSLINAEKSVRSVGLGVGGGYGAANASLKDAYERQVGAVTATANIASIDPKTSTPITTATGRAVADFMMISDGYTLVGSVALGLGGGVTRETTRLVNPQSAALFATRAAILAAVAQQWNLDSVGKTCFGAS